MYLLKIKCSSQSPLRSQSPKTQVPGLAASEKPRERCRAGAEVGKPRDAAVLCWKPGLTEDKQLFQSHSETPQKGTKGDDC